MIIVNDFGLTNFVVAKATFAELTALVRHRDQEKITCLQQAMTQRWSFERNRTAIGMDMRSSFRSIIAPSNGLRANLVGVQRLQRTWMQHRVSHAYLCSNTFLCARNQYCYFHTENCGLSWCLSHGSLLVDILNHFIV